MQFSQHSVGSSVKPPQEKTFNQIASPQLNRPSSRVTRDKTSSGLFGPIQNVIATDLSNQFRVVLLDVLHCGLNKGLVALRLNHQAALAIDYFAHVSPSTH
jgi:hypothetical protein